MPRIEEWKRTLPRPVLVVVFAAFAMTLLPGQESCEPPEEEPAVWETPAPKLAIFSPMEGHGYLANPVLPVIVGYTQNPTDFRAELNGTDVTSLFAVRPDGATADFGESLEGLALLEQGTNQLRVWVTHPTEGTLAAQRNFDYITDEWPDHVVALDVEDCPDNDHASLLHAIREEDADYLSLGPQGSITLAFTNNVIVDGDGNDLKFYEPGDSDRCTVEVSADGVSFTTLGSSGGGSFDLADFGLSEARFVRLTDENTTSCGSGSAPGCDVDSVEALNTNPRLDDFVGSVEPMAVDTGPYVDAAIDFVQAYECDTNHMDLDTLLGEPDNQYVSTAYHGSVTVAFLKNSIVDGPGVDFEFKEYNSNEYASIEASPDGFHWAYLGRYYGSSSGRLVDLAGSEITEARFLRISDAYNKFSVGCDGSRGFDLDAVTILNVSAPSLDASPATLHRPLIRTINIGANDIYAVKGLAVPGSRVHVIMQQILFTSNNPIDLDDYVNPPEPITPPDGILADEETGQFSIEENVDIQAIRVDQKGLLTNFTAIAVKDLDGDGFTDGPGEYHLQDLAVAPVLRWFRTDKISGGDRGVSDMEVDLFPGVVSIAVADGPNGEGNEVCGSAPDIDQDSVYFGDGYALVEPTSFTFERDGDGDRLSPFITIDTSNLLPMCNPEFDFILGIGFATRPGGGFIATLARDRAEVPNFVVDVNLDIDGDFDFGFF